MGVNFRDALTVLYRALPAVLFRAGIFVAGGFMVIIVFGMLLFASRFAGGAGPVMFIIVFLLVGMGLVFSSLLLQRFFLYRHQAAMLLLFSGCSLSAPGLAAAIRETRRFFPDHSRWAVVNRGLRRALSAFYQGSAEFPEVFAVAANRRFSGVIDLLAKGPLSQAILVLAFSRGSMDPGRSAREGLSLYFSCGKKSRRLARQWLWFSATGLALLFLCLALPNRFFFKSTGTPVWIGMVLAAAIAMLLYQAFVIPFVLAGLSGALQAETCSKTPDSDLCDKLGFLIPDTLLPGKSAN